MSKSCMTGKTALITGSSRGIGRAIAVKLAEEGIFACINFLQNENAAEEALQAVKVNGGRGALYPFDVADLDAVRGAVDDIVRKHGRLDILVNNAGSTLNSLIMRTGELDWKRLLEVNLTGTFNCCQAVSRTMVKQRWGRIINVTSVVAEAGNAGQAAYSAAKAGILGLTKSLARELGSRNICVNAVSPGLIDTDMTHFLSTHDRNRLCELIPLRRAGTPEDVAGLVSFLVSPQADYITGQVIRINGGLYM